MVTAGVTDLLPPRAYNLPMIRTSIAIALGAAVVIAGCGAANKPPTSGSTVAGRPTTQDPGAAAYRYSACMREKGVSGFPDPVVKSSGNQVSVMTHITPQISGSPAFKSAQQACAHLLPNGGVGQNGPTAAQLHAREQALLAFAGCMRRHGFARFPDPTSDGQLSLQAIQAAGINLTEPAVKPAALACSGLTHGIITKADVERAISDPGASGHQQAAAGG